MPSLPNPQLKLKLPRRARPDVVGLDIQPGHVTAVQASVNGKIVAERAAALALPADTVREGEVLDGQALSESLRELFRNSGLPKRVRVGVANQRTVLRTLELPPVGDRKELDGAVRFVAQEQVPMPLASAVLDYHALGVHDTPAGPRQQVVLVAAQRDMIARLLTAVRQAGLRADGIDLSAFALIRSLRRVEAEPDSRILYLNVDGLTNMAIAEGVVCRFTRVVGGGLEAMASQLAERRSIPVTEARAAIAAADLVAPAATAAAPVAAPAPQEGQDAQGAVSPRSDEDAPSAVSSQSAVSPQSDEDAQGVVNEHQPDEREKELRAVLENGIREIAGEVRNSLDFHRSQEGGGEVAQVVLSGAALDIRGFREALQAELRMDLTPAGVTVADGALTGAAADLSPRRLTIATGLAIEEGPSQ